MATEREKIESIRRYFDLMIEFRGEHYAMTKSTVFANVDGLALLDAEDSWTSRFTPIAGRSRPLLIGGGVGIPVGEGVGGDGRRRSCCQGQVGRGYAGQNHFAGVGSGRSQS